jgi:thioester reductase-like protein
MHGEGKSVVVSGATGFLGREVVRGLLEQSPETRIVCLVRGNDAADAEARVAKLLDEVIAPAARDDAGRRVRALRSNLEAPQLGLDDRSYAALIAETASVIHGAASVSFTLPVDEARAINVEGTRRMLDLAKAAKARLDYVGTAYVAGEQRGLVRESSLDVGQSFRNTYEQTKLEAEALVRSRMGEQALCIHRPSIIVGDSRTGRTSSFKVLYWPLKIYARGLWRVVPGRRETPVDVVPSDYVVDALLALRERPGSIGETYHLAAGPERSASLAEITALASRFFGSKRAVFVDPRMFVRFARPVLERFARGQVKRIAATGRVYTPYLSLEMQFDTHNARRDLAGTGISVPPVSRYFERLFQYCVESDWGKRAPSQAA